MEYDSDSERNVDTNSIVDEPWRYYTKWNKQDTRGQITVWSHSSEVPRAVRFRNTEETGGDRNEELVFEEYRVSTCSVNGWRWWLHSHVNVLNAQNRTLKDGRDFPSSLRLHLPRQRAGVPSLVRGTKIPQAKGLSQKKRGGGKLHIYFTTIFKKWLQKKKRNEVMIHATTWMNFMLRS